MLIIEILRFSGSRYFYDFRGIPFPIFFFLSFSLSVPLSFSRRTYISLNTPFFPAFATTLRKYSCGEGSTAIRNESPFPGGGRRRAANGGDGVRQEV